MEHMVGMSRVPSASALRYPGLSLPLVESRCLEALLITRAGAVQWPLPSLSSLRFWQKFGSSSQPGASHVQVEKRQLQMSAWGPHKAMDPAGLLGWSPLLWFLAWSRGIAAWYLQLGMHRHFLCQCKPASSCRHSCGSLSPGALDCQPRSWMKLCWGVHGWIPGMGWLS